jgi:hypothetical protein
VGLAAAALLRQEALVVHRINLPEAVAAANAELEAGVSQDRTSFRPTAEWLRFYVHRTIRK